MPLQKRSGYLTASSAIGWVTAHSAQTIRTFNLSEPLCEELLPIIENRLSEIGGNLDVVRFLAAFRKKKLFLPLSRPECIWGRDLESILPSLSNIQFLHHTLDNGKCMRLLSEYRKPQF